MPVDILLRSEKGSILTHDEFDQNMENLQDGVNASRPETVAVTSATYDVSTLRVILADATAASIAVNLPDPAENADKVIYVKKVDASVNTVTITPNASETIDGASTLVLSTQWEKTQLISDGVNWFIL